MSNELQPEQYDTWFIEGKLCAEFGKGMEACSYAADDFLGLARRWWARGNESGHRILRAIRAELILNRIKAIQNKPKFSRLPWEQGYVDGYNAALAEVRNIIES